MIRLLIFLLWIVFFAGALTLLFSIRSAIPLEAFGWRMDIPAGLAILVTLAIAGVVAIAVSIAKDLALAPKAARAKKEIDRREKGVEALTRGLEAIAAGNSAAARREAQIAYKTLGTKPVTRLIAAQADMLSGDDAAAGEALAQLRGAPETEFLASQGLYEIAMRAGDYDVAGNYAERAFDRRDSVRWAFDAVFGLALRRNDFASAKAAIERAAKSKAIDQATADRGIAATLSAAAYASHAAGDVESALESIDSALKHAPAFAPAAVLSAQLHAANGDLRKVEKILGAAFSLAPCRAVAEIFASLFSGEGAAALERFSLKNPASREGALLRAKAALIRGDATAAAAELTEMLKASAPARALLLMAEAQSALSGEGAARPWFLRAAAAPRDHDPGADVFFRITSDGWRRLIREYMEEGRFGQSPLDAAPPGLSDDELALSAPAEAIDANEIDAEAAVGIERDAGDDTDADEALDREAAAARRVN